MSNPHNTALSLDRKVLDSSKVTWLLAALALTLMTTHHVYVEYGLFEVKALLLGSALGIVFLQASFGFTTAWRRLLNERRGLGIRAQMIMLALSVILFFPTLASGELFGQSVSGFVRPLGLSVIVGALMFGIGMQIANGCASGNLFHLGAGQLRAIPVMAGFSAGALWATSDYEGWTSLPQLAPVNMIESFGPVLAIAINLAVFAAIFQFTRYIEHKRHGATETFKAEQTMPLWRRVIQGPWPLIWGAIALALLNFATLGLLGRPWVVALAYPVWGAKAAEYFNLDLEVDFWTYWVQPGRDDALYNALLQDPATLMNLGVILGAFVAATVAGKFSLSVKMPIPQWIASILGGVLLGYGATIAYGCNIGAFIGGIVSGSLHGWLWLIFAVLGSAIGIRLRPYIGLK